jgi:hypothetical protein
VFEKRICGTPHVMAEGSNEARYDLPIFRSADASNRTPRLAISVMTLSEASAAPHRHLHHDAGRPIAHRPDRERHPGDPAP